MFANCRFIIYVHEMFYVYIITNRRNGTLYIGQTEDIGARMEQHQNGIFKGFAHKYGCTRLVWFEEHPTRDSAFRRERQMKAWRRSWKIELIEKANPHWLDISQMKVWPLPQREVFADLRKQLMQDGKRGEQNPR